MANKFSSFEEYYQNNSSKGQKVREKNIELAEREKKLKEKVSTNKLIIKNKPMAKMKIASFRVPTMSRNQSVMQEMFGGQNKVIMPNAYSESLPNMNGVLRTGGGLIKTGTGDRTARMFGLFSR